MNSKFDAFLQPVILCYAGIANQKRYIFFVCSSIYPSVKIGMKVKLHLFVDDIET